MRTTVIWPQLFFLLTPPTNMEQTEFSEMSAKKKKFRRLGITQKKEYNTKNTRKFEIKNKYRIVDSDTYFCLKLHGVLRNGDKPQVTRKYFKGNVIVHRSIK